MKILLAAFICITVFNAKAQHAGIKFEDNLTWAEVKQKAKAENRYIFVDCYTTWCAPCKVMARDVFTQPMVSEFFNKEFVSVALQFDKTKNDNNNTRRWFAEVKRIEKEYKVSAYPTYLFFSPDGLLVHSIIGGSDATTFIAKAKNAINPATQLVNLKKQYADGNRSPEFVLAFIKALGQAWDSQVNEVINVYLLTQNNLHTRENLEFIAKATTKSTDPGFEIVRKNAKEFDDVNGYGRSNAILEDIAFDELVLPKVRINGAKVNQGGMYFYTGDINKNVNWAEVKSTLAYNYPDLAEEIFLKSKIQYVRDLEDWTSYALEATTYTSKYSDLAHSDQIDTYANDIFLFSENKQCLEQALIWSNQIINLPLPTEKKDWYSVTKANLLYKLGRKDEALAITTEAIKRLADKAGRFKDLQEKIDHNQKAW